MEIFGMITVEDLYREDVSDTIISVAGGRELRGPCPGCGGNDRFGVYTAADQGNGRGSFFCGRYKGAANTGCGKGGDIIQYLRDFRNMSYKDACGLLGVDLKKTSKTLRQSHFCYSALTQPPRKPFQGFKPENKSWPPEVVDSAKWQEHAAKFVNYCHNELLKRNATIAYLMQRGISMEVIREFKLGYNPGQETRGKKEQPTYRPWPSWGLRDEKNNNGRSRLLALPAGVVIPTFTNDEITGITIRRNKPDQHGNVYHYVNGTIRGLFVTNPQAHIFVTIEAQLDCLAVASAAGDLVGTIGIGSTGVKPDKVNHARLRRSDCILGSLDFDKVRQNPKTGRTEMPGGFASTWWEKTYPQHKRWPVPVGKDPGEAFQAGVDLRDWILAGLPEHLVPAAEREEPAADQQHVEAPLSIEYQLPSGQLIYLVPFDEFGRMDAPRRHEWQRLMAEGKPAFTEKEIKLLAKAASKMSEAEAEAFGQKAIEAKITFGGYISGGRVLEEAEEVEDIEEEHISNGRQKD